MSTLKTNTLSNVAGTASTAIENAINGSAKAWVNFDGTGTVAIRASYNVSSITDNGAGQYTVNFTNSLADANYSLVATTGVNASVASIINIHRQATATPLTTTSARICIYSGGFLDGEIVTVSIFR